jgi:hypothetical protein
MHTNKYVAMLLAAIAGLVAGLVTLKLLGQPTPL